MCDVQCNFECVASYPGSRNVPGAVTYLTCPLPGTQQEYCNKRQKFNELVEHYRETGDDMPAALWKARAVNKIPTEYDITGEVRSWRKAYRPDTVAEVEAREQAFFGDHVPQLHCQAPEREQISFWDMMGGEADE